MTPPASQEELAAILEELGAKNVALSDRLRWAEGEIARIDAQNQAMRKALDDLAAYTRRQIKDIKMETVRCR